MNWTNKVYDWLRINHPLAGDCLLCGLPAASGLCTACEQELPRLGAACVCCATPLATDGVCGACLRHPPPFSAAAAAFRYQSPLSDLIIMLKFHGRLAAARPLGRLLADAIASSTEDLPDVIVPVPLHPARLRERGYNQALELARPVAKRLGIPLAPDLCIRRRVTATQSDLKLEERRQNVQGAFAAKGKLPRRIALVDDVITTGSTAAAAAQTLLRAGAGEVRIWALARAAE